MHTVETLELALSFATRHGYRVRQEWLDGSPGGACEIRGQKWLFLDPSQNAIEQLALVLDALSSDERLQNVPWPRTLRRLAVSRGPIASDGEVTSAGP